MLKASDEAQQNIAVGRSENLHEAMITTEKAEVGLKYVMQIRNKVLDNYQTSKR